MEEATATCVNSKKGEWASSDHTVPKGNRWGTQAFSMASLSQFYEADSPVRGASPGDITTVHIIASKERESGGRRLERWEDGGRKMEGSQIGKKEDERKKQTRLAVLLPISLCDLPDSGPRSSLRSLPQIPVAVPQAKSAWTKKGD